MVLYLFFFFSFFLFSFCLPPCIWRGELVDGVGCYLGRVLVLYWAYLVLRWGTTWEQYGAV